MPKKAGPLASHAESMPRSAEILACTKYQNNLSLIMAPKVNKENLSMNLQRKTLKPQQVLDNVNSFTNNDFGNMMARSGQWVDRGKELMVQSLAMCDRSPREHPAHIRNVTQHLRAYPYDADGILEATMAMVGGGSGGQLQGNLEELHNIRQTLHVVKSAMGNGEQRSVRRRIKRSRKSARRAKSRKA